MKVVHVESGRHLYGGALQVLSLLRGLPEHGVESVLVCPPESGIAAAARESGIVTHELPIRGDLDLSFVFRLMAVLRRERPDIVHLHSRRGADVLGGIAARLSGVPAVVSRRVDNPEPRWLAIGKYRLFDAVVTISKGIGDVLVREGVPRDRIRCVPSAVDTSLYRPTPDDGWFRKEFELPLEAPVIGMAAQFIPRKGHAVLVQAAPEILRVHPDVCFLLLGRGPEEPAVREAVRRAGLERSFRFPGFREDMTRILPNLTLLVHPASMEGLGVALLQAAACEVPIVASRVGGIPEVVGHGLNGHLVSPGDVNGLAAAVTELLDEPLRREQYGKAGRDRICSHFSITAMVRGNLAVYRDVLS